MFLNFCNNNIPSKYIKSKAISSHSTEVLDINGAKASNLGINDIALSVVEDKSNLIYAINTNNK